MIDSKLKENCDLLVFYIVFPSNDNSLLLSLTQLIYLTVVHLRDQSKKVALEGYVVAIL